MMISKGTFVPELEELYLTTHRQLLAGQNRIIIERGENDTVYVHMIAHTSRDLEALIRRRLLSSWQDTLGPKRWPPST